VPHTLLLADDSVTIQRVIELTFADEDVHVIAVSDGDQAIARIEASPPDIILADIGMPGRNGYEVAQYVKQSPRLAHIPVVLLTGAFEPVDQARAQAAGCEGVLAKPFEPQLVISRVKELLGKPRAAGAAGLAPPLAPPPPLPSALDDDWPQPRADQMAAISPEPPATGVDDLNNYFDRLDAAFANLGAPAPVTPPPPAAAAPSPDDVDWFGTINAVDVVHPERWDLAEPPAAQPPADDLPLTYASPLADFEHLPGMPVDTAPEIPADDSFAAAGFDLSVDVPPPAPPVAVDAPSVAPVRTVVPAPFVIDPVAEAAEPERSAPAATVAARVAPLPALADAFAALLAAEQRAGGSMVASSWLEPVSAAAAAQITDEVIEAVVRRVLERLSDQVVRETVSGLVSAIAERLVREEIERIKSAIP
jgi:CheY-like chemotaxis protein